MKGTPDLLFVALRTDAVCFIDVRPHDSFSDEQLFDVARSNWPHLFEHARLVGAISLEHDATAEERKALRAAGVNVMTPVGGAVFGPVGGGVTTSGLPVGRAEIRDSSDRTYETLAKFV